MIGLDLTGLGGGRSGATTARASRVRTGGGASSDAEPSSPPFESGLAIKLLNLGQALQLCHPQALLRQPDFLFLIGFSDFGPGLVPLDSDRNSVHNGGGLASGTLLWTPFVPKTKVQRTYYFNEM